MRTLYLCGAGNSEGVRLALTINRHQRRWERMVLLDDDSAKHGRSMLGVDILGPFAMLQQADSDSDEVVNLVARTTKGRWAARRKIESYGIGFAALVHPNVDVFGAQLPRDILVYEYAVVSPEIVVGEASVIFMGACVGHECCVGRCCVMATNSVLNARVELSDLVYVGTNASVLPELKVGQEATIGANSSVIQDVPGGATAIGVPAQNLVQSTKESERDVPAATFDDGGSTAALPGPSDVELERILTEICMELLSRPHVGPADNFFDMGGTSLLAIRWSERIKQAVQRDLPLTDVYRFPTVRSLAHHLGSQVGERHESPSSRARAEAHRDRLARRKLARRR